MLPWTHPLTASALGFCDKGPVNKIKKEGVPAKSRSKTVTGRVLSDFDAHLFREGTHARLYDKLGCHLLGEPGEQAAQLRASGRRTPPRCR